MKPNVVAIAVDANFFPPAAFLATRLAALNPRDDTGIVLFCDAVELLRQAQAFSVPADLRHVRAVPFPSRGRFTAAAYYRVFIPQALGPEVRRILYLDADVYPENAGIFGLFDLDMGEHAVAAARALAVDFSQGGGTRKTFNSGVLLIDRERYLAEDLANAVMKQVTSASTLDQDALNAALRDKWLELSPGMNMTEYASKAGGGSVRAALTHFAGQSKPWHRDSVDHPSAKEISTYLASSPWSGYRDKFEPPGGRRPPIVPPATVARAITAYLRETRFADVAQGLTPPLF